MLPNLHMLIKQKGLSLYRNLALRTFGELPIVFLNKGKSAIPPLFNDLEMLPSASNKARLFAENFPKTSNLHDSGISLPVFPSRTNLKLHNISVTPKMVKKVIMNIDLLKASGPGLFSDFQMVLDLLNQLRIFLPLHLIELLDF